MKTSCSLVMSVILMAVALAGCNAESNLKNFFVSTNFSLTASRQNTIAQNNFQKTLSFFLSSAVALTPGPLEDATGAIVTLNEAWIVLKKIQFHATETANANESSDNSAHYNGPFYIDLLSETPLLFGEIDLPNREFKRVKMLLHKDNNVPDNVPAVLNGKSIYINGIVNTYNFIYAADDTTDFEISGPDAVVPEQGKDLLAVIRIANLFKKINLSSITADTTITSTSRFPATNPCPDIHPTAPDLYTCFRMGLAQEAKLGKDNGTGDLEN